MNDTTSTATVTYSSGKLKEALLLISEWLEEAKRRGLPDPTSISLATADLEGRPSVRTVYLSDINEEGVVFFINLRSGKGQQILHNPNVGLCRYWPELQQQVTLEGEIETLPEMVCDELWRHRSRDSQLASWASDQRLTTSDAGVLTETRDELKSSYDFETIPRPDHWRALLVHPSRVEFWETGWHRLRQRKLYTRSSDGSWRLEVENP